MGPSVAAAAHRVVGPSLPASVGKRLVNWLDCSRAGLGKCLGAQPPEPAWVTSGALASHLTSVDFGSLVCRMGIITGPLWGLDELMCKCLEGFTVVVYMHILFVCKFSAHAGPLTAPSGSGCSADTERTAYKPDRRLGPIPPGVLTAKQARVGGAGGATPARST